MVQPTKVEGRRGWYRRFVEHLDPDAALHLMTRLSERGRLYRLVNAIRAAAGGEQALALVDRELDGRLPAVVHSHARAALGAHVLERVREMKLEPNRVTAQDARAARCPQSCRSS